MAHQIRQTDRVIHISFEQPLRSISNGVNGEGLQWSRHFCNFHVDRYYNGSNPQAEMREWLKELDIPFEQTVGMMTAVFLKDAAFVCNRSERYSLIVMATAGVGNAVDITYALPPVPKVSPGTINMMVFVDGHLTDGALVNAVISATEAKSKALYDRNVRDPRSQTVATGTSTDSLLIAATQKGEPTPYAGSGTELGKLIGQTVYQAVQQSLDHYIARRRA